MMIGDIVFNKTNKKTGRIVSFMKRNPGALIDYSDRSGIMFRWSDRNYLEVIR